MMKKSVVVTFCATLTGFLLWYNGINVKWIKHNSFTSELHKRGDTEAAPTGFLRPHHPPQLPNLPVVGDLCAKNKMAWDCVGMDREWGLVFIDHRPGSRRTVDFLRMLSRSVSLIIHDTEQPTYGWPQGWLGRKNYTERTFLQERKDGSHPEHLWYIGTTLIQGDLDKDGSVFNQIVESIKKSTIALEDLEKDGMSFAKKLNLQKPRVAYGTHLRLVRTAASLTQGDILEFGTGLFSTPALDRVVKASRGRRMMVSADTDLLWLRHLIHRFNHRQHQFLLVPAYSDLVGCYSGIVKEPVNISAGELALLGNPVIGKTFLDATC